MPGCWNTRAGFSGWKTHVERHSRHPNSIEPRTERALSEVLTVLPDQPEVAAADGGSDVIVAPDDGEVLDEGDDEECACDELPDGPPCFECYRDGVSVVLQALTCEFIISSPCG